MSLQVCAADVILYPVLDILNEFVQIFFWITLIFFLDKLFQDSFLTNAHQ